MQYAETIVFFWHAGVVDDYFEFVKQIALHSPDKKLIAVIPNKWPELPGQMNILDDKKYGDIANLQIIKLRTFFTGDFRFYLYVSLFGFLKKIEGKVHLIFITEPYILSATQFLWARFLLRNKLRSSWTFSAQNIFKKFGFPFSYLESRVLSTSNELMVMSECSKKIYERKNFNGKFFYFPLGNSQRLIAAGADSFQSFSSSDHKFCVVYFGRLVKEKGIADLAEIIKRSEIERLDIEFKIVGSGPLESEIKFLSQKHSSVKYYGSLDRPSLFKVLEIADVNILLSRSTNFWTEQFGRTIIEAKAFGIPTVAYDSGEIKNVVADNTMVFTEGDYDSVFTKLKDLCNDTETLAKKKRRVFEESKAFTWKSIATRFCETLEKNYGR